MSVIDKIKYDNDSYEIADNRDLPREFWMGGKLYGKLWVHNNLTSLDLNNNHYQYDELNGFSNGTGKVSNGIYFFNNSNSDTWNGRISSLVDAGGIKGGLGVGLSARSLNKINDNYINNNFWIAETIDGKPYYYITNSTAFRRDTRDNNSFKENSMTGTKRIKTFAAGVTDANISLTSVDLTPGTWLVTGQFRFTETANTINKGYRLGKIIIDGKEQLSDSVMSTAGHPPANKIGAGAYLTVQRLVNIPKPSDPSEWTKTTKVHLVVWQDSGAEITCTVGKINAAII